MHVLWQCQIKCIIYEVFIWSFAPAQANNTVHIFTENSHEPIAIFNKIQINFMNFPQVHKTFSLCVIYQTEKLCAVGFGLSALNACTIVDSIAI